MSEMAADKEIKEGIKDLRSELNKADPIERAQGVLLILILMLTSFKGEDKAKIELKFDILAKAIDCFRDDIIKHLTHKVIKRCQDPEDVGLSLLAAGMKAEERIKVSRPQLINLVEAWKTSIPDAEKSPDNSSNVVDNGVR